MPSSPFCRWGNETQGDTVAGQVSSQSKGVAEMNFQRSWLQISWLQSPSAVILEPKKIKSAIVSPSICHEVGSKITADVDCNYEIKRRLLLGRKVMTNLDSIFGEGNGTPLRYFAWKIPWMEEPGRLQSVGSLRVRHDWATSLSLFTFLNWRRKWQPTAVFLSGESQGWGSLVAAVYGVAQSRTRLKWLSSSSRQHIKNQRHYFANKGLCSQGYGFSSSHVWMWKLYYKESWAPNNWCFWAVVLEKALESPLDCKEIHSVHPKGDQSWVFIGRTDVEAETPVLWPPDAKTWLIWKRPWCWERLRAGGEGDNRGWDGWMASPAQWTWVWVDSESWWWTGRPGVLRFMGLQRVRHDWVTELITSTYVITQ